MNPVQRAFDAQVDSVDKANRSLVARINTAGVDRYRTVIDPRGGKLENYRKNPAVLWEHGKDPRRFTDPIGRNVWIKNNGGQRPTELLARTKFLEDDFSQQRFEWYRDGTLNAFSVNILPVEERTGPPTREEMRDAPAWESAELVYREWELAEYSGTVIPGNADCLVSERAAKMLGLVDRGLWLPDDVRALVEERAGKVEDKVIEERAAEAPKHDRRSAPYIDTDGQTWTVRDADKRAMAMYSDARDAEESLRLMMAARPDTADGFTRSLLGFLAEQRAADEQRMQDMMARIELKLFGRV